jgi:hypothetical protein
MADHSAVTAAENDPAEAASHGIGHAVAREQ